MDFSEEEMGQYFCVAVSFLEFVGISPASRSQEAARRWAIVTRSEYSRFGTTVMRQLKAAVEYGQVMPNIPQMGRFFSSVSGALQIATEDRASATAALQEAEANMLHR